MRRTLISAVVWLMLLVFLAGCAVVTNVRRQEDGSEKHIVAILGIPLWLSEKPIDQSAKGQ